MFKTVLLISLILTSCVANSSNKIDEDTYAVVEVFSVMPTFQNSAYEVSDTTEINAKFNRQGIGEKIKHAWLVSLTDTTKCELVAYNRTPLLKERVKISAVGGLSGYGSLIQIEFRFSDPSLWQKITADNVGQRLAVALNGVILCAPKVNMPIESGNCAVTVTPSQFDRYFPDLNVGRMSQN